MHPFDQVVALAATADGRLRGHTSDAYWNMVSPFGGATAATALNGVLVHPQRRGDPVALTVNFAAPIAKGEVIVEPRLMRANRSTQHWSVEIRQGPERALMVNAIALLGVRRPTWGVTEAVMPQVKPPEACPRPPKRMPFPWIEMYDIRVARGQIPSPERNSLTHAWLSDREPRPVDFLSLTAYCDMFPPRIFFHRAQPVPLGTVSLTIYYHADATEVAAQGAEPVLGVAQGQIAHNNYYDHHGQIWGRRGKLLATTQQIAWYKE
jgi:acyl-CoA thioesterase